MIETTTRLNKRNKQPLRSERISSFPVQNVQNIHLKPENIFDLFPIILAVEAVPAHITIAKKCVCTSVRWLAFYPWQSSRKNERPQAQGDLKLSLLSRAENR